MIKHDLTYIPHTSGIYQFKNDQWKVLYIGKAKNLHKRLSQYFSPWSTWKRDMLEKATNIDFIEVKNETDALMLEDNLIKQYRPEFNRLLKNTNYYCFVKISNHDFPRIYITRDRKDDWSTYIWPKKRGRELRKILDYLRTIFKFRTMSENAFKKWTITLDYHMWLDEWWSIIAKRNWSQTQLRKEKAKQLWIDTTKSYDRYKDEYKRRITVIKRFLQWDTDLLLRHIKNRINYYVKEQNFEYCIHLRDIHRFVENMEEKRQHIVFDISKTWYCMIITTVNSVHCIIIIYIFQWTIIDIIREKKLSEDFSINQLKATANAEYNTTKTRTTKHWYSMSYENSLVWLWKKNRWIIDEHMDRFLQSYISSNHFKKDSLILELLKEFMSMYDLDRFPYHIECMDISHISGWYTSWWLSVFINGVPYKKLYRQYKIKADKGDDFSSLTECITRRFKLFTNWLSTENLPDLFIIDWWKWHLSIFDTLYKNNEKFQKICMHTLFATLGKWKARTKKWKLQWHKQYLRKRNKKWDHKHYICGYTLPDRFLYKIRDEAHRFSNRYRKKQMSMQRNKK